MKREGLTEEETKDSGLQRGLTQQEKGASTCKASSREESMRGVVRIQRLSPLDHVAHANGHDYHLSLRQLTDFYPLPNLFLSS